MSGQAQSVGHARKPVEPQCLFAGIAQLVEQLICNKWARKNGQNKW